MFGLGYQFDDKTRFNSEYEVEHAVSSADDPGEFEVEQFYVDRKINDAVSGRGGLFLIPAGLLNENHEPTNFYGVQRNFVETLIIPSTWREGGLSVYGSTDSGFDWNVGLTSGMDLSKWDFAPEAPLYTSALELINNDVAPFQATHQELALASAKNLAQYVSLNYRGVPGLTVGGTYYTGLAVPAQPNIGNQRTSLWETHVRYQPNKWDLSALYANGTISNAGAANAQFPGTANPMPSRFDGWFAQAAYNLVAKRRLSPRAVRPLRVLQHGRFVRGHRAGLPVDADRPGAELHVADLVQLLSDPARSRRHARRQFLSEPERGAEGRLPEVQHQHRLHARRPRARPGVLTLAAERDCRP